MAPRFTNAERLFQLLVAQSHFLIEASSILSQILSSSPPEHREINHRLHKSEQGADDACHEVCQIINQSFVLPFDRDDLYTLTTAIDDVVDLLDEAGDNIVLYKPAVLPDDVSTQVDILRKCAELTVTVMESLPSLGEETKRYWIEINQLENQGDKLYRRIIADMFENAHDPLEVLKIKAVVDALEGALDAFESLAATIESIAIKES